MRHLLSIAVLLAACDSTIASGVGAEGGEGGAGGAAGAGGVGAAGAGGATACVPGETTSCYDGPPGTEGVGICAPGSRTCGPDGTFGACVGQVLPAAEACATAADEDCDGATAACPPWWLTWGDDVPNMGVKNDHARALEVDELGNVYVLSQYDGAFDFDGLPVAEPGGSAVLVGKIGSTGNAEWVQPIASSAGSAYPGGLSFHEASQRLAVAGAYVGDVVIGGQAYPGFSPVEPSVESYLVSFDAAGAIAWTDTFATDGTQSVADVDFEPGGDVVLTGNTGTPADFGGGNVPTGLLLARFDGAGQHAASAGYASGFGWHVTVASDGTTFVAGSVWDQTVSFGNGVTVGGGPDEDAFVVALDATGAALWGRTLGGTGAQRVTALAVDEQGSLFLTVAWDGDPDLGAGPVPFANETSGWVGRYAAADGSLVWGRVLGGARLEGVAATGTRVYAVGWFTGVLDLGPSDGSAIAVGGEDLFVARLDAATGADAGTAVIGTPANERAVAVAVGPTGIFVAGRWTGAELDLGAGPFDPPLSGNAKSFVSWSPF